MVFVPAETRIAYESVVAIAVDDKASAVDGSGQALVAACGAGGRGRGRGARHRRVAMVFLSTSSVRPGRRQGMHQQRPSGCSEWGQTQALRMPTLRRNGTLNFFVRFVNGSPGLK